MLHARFSVVLKVFLERDRKFFITVLKSLYCTVHMFIYSQCLVQLAVYRVRDKIKDIF